MEDYVRGIKKSLGSVPKAKYKEKYVRKETN